MVANHLRDRVVRAREGMNGQRWGIRLQTAYQEFRRDKGSSHEELIQAVMKEEKKERQAAASKVASAEFKKLSLDELAVYERRAADVNLGRADAAMKAEYVIYCTPHNPRTDHSSKVCEEAPYHISTCLL